MRFMLVGLVAPFAEKEKMLADFEEAQSLVRTFGGEVFAASSQNNVRADNATYIGKGKAQEIADTISKEKIDIVVINDTVKPGQLFTLKKIFERSNQEIMVWDRVELILQIFSKHAATSEAKLQIRLAQMRHMGPRIFGMGMVMSQQGGGIGTRGIGETNTELMQRHWRDEMKQVRIQLSKLIQTRQQQINRRKRSGLLTVSIVGYTNAGKTTLFNALAKEKNLVENSLFITLDSNVSKIYLPSLAKEVYLSDTIGFIQKLPPQLIEAFKSTLMETVQADLILHVIDTSDPWLNDKIETVEKVLFELGCNTKKQIYVFNKLDLAKTVNINFLSEKYKQYKPQFVEANSGKGCNELKEAIQKLIMQ